MMKRETKKALKFILIILLVCALPELLIVIGWGWALFTNSFYNSSTKYELMMEIEYDGLDFVTKDTVTLKSFETVEYEGQLCRAYVFKIHEKSPLFLETFEAKKITQIEEENGHPLCALFGEETTAFRSSLDRRTEQFLWACYANKVQLKEFYEGTTVSMIAIYEGDKSLLYVYRYNI